jgi:hypothetical protein
MIIAVLFFLLLSVIFAAEICKVLRAQGIPISGLVQGALTTLILLAFVLVLLRHSDVAFALPLGR